MVRAIVLIAVIIAAASASASAAVIYQEDFSTDARLFGNERGDWGVAGGVYNAAQPGNLPPDYSALPFNLRDFSVEMDINGVSDGGVWLRSRDNAGRMSGVLLVTGGYHMSGRGFYWHIVNDDSYGGATNHSAVVFNQGDNVHIRVTAQGDTYAVYLNGSETPATTLTTSQFPAGAVGLYDFSNQTFDNVKVEVNAPAYSIGLRSARQDIIQNASARFLFTVYGTVTFKMPGAIEIDDGSGDILNVYTPGESVADYGSFIRATGLLFPNGPVTDMSCMPSAIEILAP